MVSFKKTTEIFTLFSILFFAFSARGQTSGSIYTIPKGTQIRVKMDNEINSKVSSVGDTFTATISVPVVNREIEVLPVGTVLEARIIRVKKAGIGKSRGDFEVKFETLYFSREVKLQIDAGLLSSAKAKSSNTRNAVTIAGATGVGALIGTLAAKTKGALIGAGAGLGIGMSAILLQKGEEARIKAGEEFSIVLNRDLILPPQDY
jgi:hypothetical protein